MNLVVGGLAQVLADHVHIYVDASFDENGYSGVGGVMYDSSGSLLAFFSEELSPEFIAKVKRGWSSDHHSRAGDAGTSDGLVFVELLHQPPKSGDLHRQ